MRPLLVTGPARSGTTLVARMLAAHPRVEVAVDPLFPVVREVRDALAAQAGLPLPPGTPLQDGYGDADRVALLDAVVGGSLDVPAPPRAPDALRDAVRARCGIESPDLVETAAALTGRTWGDVLRRFLEGVASVRGAAPGAVVGLKEVWAAPLVPAFLRADPAARAILIRRDPRAVLASNLAMGRRDPSQVAHPLSVLRHWRAQEALGAWLAARPDLGARTLVVGYESLLRDPDGVTARICAFLEVPADGSMTDPDRILDAEGRPFVANTSHEARGAGIDPALAERWRSRLEVDRVALAEAVCAHEMAAAGYDLVAGPPGAGTGVLAEAVAADHEGLWSWRSDLGDPALDTALELARGSLVAASPEVLPASVERPLFLFTEARRALAAVPTTTTAAAVPAPGGPR